MKWQFDKILTFDKLGHGHLPSSVDFGMINWEQSWLSSSDVKTVFWYQLTFECHRIDQDWSWFCLTARKFDKKLLVLSLKPVAKTITDISLLCLQLYSCFQIEINSDLIFFQYRFPFGFLFFFFWVCFCFAYAWKILFCFRFLLFFKSKLNETNPLVLKHYPIGI